MKSFVKSLAITIICILTLSTLFACGAAPSGKDHYAPGPGYDDGYRPSDTGKDNAELYPYPDGGSGDSGVSGEITPIRPGQLTAAAHNDNDYYEDWLKLFYKGQTSEDNGKFVEHITDNFGLYSLSRVKVTVTCGENVVEQAAVTCTKDDKTLFSAMTDAAGVAYLFPQKSSGDITVSCVINNKIQIKKTTYSATDRDVKVNFENGTSEKAKLIQLMFVIDATGSMGDEMNYLKAELGNVIERVVAKHSGDITIHLGFVFYRDDSDKQKFVVAYFKDVTDKNDYAEMQDILASVTASGGGDYPEALDEAMLMAVNKQWAADGTKIIFNLLDAPCHRTEEDKANYSSAVAAAAAKGIRICPVLASGADQFTEYLVRQAAILTGGTFTYITDDSGIGGSHHDPDLPNDVIELMNDMLVRLVDGYYTGTFEQPVHWRDSVLQQEKTNPAQ